MQVYKCTSFVELQLSKHNFKLARQVTEEENFRFIVRKRSEAVLSVRKALGGSEAFNFLCLGEDKSLFCSLWAQAVCLIINLKWIDSILTVGFSCNRLRNGRVELPSISAAALPDDNCVHFS